MKISLQIISILLILMFTLNIASAAQVKIKDISFPDTVQAGSQFTVSFDVDHGPTSGHYQVSIGGANRNGNLPPNGKVKITDFVVNNEGTHNVVISVLDEQYSQVTSDDSKSITVSGSAGTSGGSASTFQISTNNLDKTGTTIDVTYDPTAKTITFVDTSTSYTNSGITWVAYNIAQAASRIEGDGHQIYPTSLDPKELWKTKNNFGAKGEFGSFLHIYGGDAGNNPKNEHRYHTVVVTVDPFKTIEPNKLGNEVGVHYVCEEFSCFVSGTKEDVEIPEFPTIALPVAAILGLMLILGRRNKE